MAIFHLSMKKGYVGKGRAKAAYIACEDKYENKSDLLSKHELNIPAFASSAKEFFAAADKHENQGHHRNLKRKNKETGEFETVKKFCRGRSFQELEITLPKELTKKQNKEVISAFFT